MKLSNDTITILKNFSEINPNLLIKKGNILSTHDVGFTMYSIAQIGEMFELVRDFGIYDLKEFLQTIAMFRDPELTFKEHYVDIVDTQDSSIRTRYYRADDDVLKASTKAFRQVNLAALPAATASFELSNVNLKRIEKACGVLKCPDVRFVGGEGKMIAIVYDKSNAIPNTFTVDLIDNYEGADFDLHVTQKKLVMIDGDYHCEIIDNRALKCKHQDKNLNYLITFDA